MTDAPIRRVWPAIRIRRPGAGHGRAASTIAPVPAGLAGWPDLLAAGIVAGMAKLKVYRTPIGFHDAYVAAPSQKAALQAWGSDRDLFARGIAEVVTDPGLAAEALARPGVVIKRSRGTAAEQIAALPPTPARRARPEAPADEGERPRGKPKAAPAPPPKPKPKPDRTALREAEDALAEAQARHRSEDRALRAEEAALAKRRRAMEREQADERDRLDAARQAAADAYERAMQRWRG